LEIIGDLSYSLDKSHYSTQVPYLATCGAAGTLTCGDYTGYQERADHSKTHRQLSGGKSAKVALGYIYQKLNSSDYFYNGEQYGYTPNRVMPTNLQAPNYSVSVVTATILHVQVSSLQMK